MHKLVAHALGADVRANLLVDCGWQSQVEESVSVTTSRQGGEVMTERCERLAVIISASDVGVPTEEH